MKNPEFRSFLPSGAAYIPQWIEAEIGYARQKFETYPNPQWTALSGGLRPGGDAHRDFDSYLGRFEAFYRQHDPADQDPTILLRASSALGKFVNAGVVLNSVLIEAESNLLTEDADAAAIQQLYRICYSMGNSPMPDLDSYSYNFDGKLKRLADLLDGGSLSSADKFIAASDLLRDQAQLFAAFTNETLVIAQPGVNSSENVRSWVTD